MTTRRDVLSATWPDINLCEDATNCVKRYGAKPGKVAHEHGTVDNWGTIHLSDLDRPVRPRGIYRLCVLVALSRNPEMRRLPTYYRLWRSHVWGHEELLRKFRKRSRISWSWKERTKAWRLAERAGLRVIDTGDMFYLWCFHGREIARKRGVAQAQSLHRYRVPEELKAAWVEDRKAGMSFSEIGRKYKRDFRAVWKVMVRAGIHKKDVI